MIVQPDGKDGALSQLRPPTLAMIRKFGIPTETLKCRNAMLKSSTNTVTQFRKLNTKSI